MSEPAQRSGAFDRIGWGTVSRRRFLRGAGFVCAGVGVGLGASACREDHAMGLDGRPLLALDARQAATLAAVADAVVPTQPGFPTAAQAQVLRRFDEELSFVAPSIRDDLRAALDVLEFLPPLYGRLSRFSTLDAAGRRDVLTRMCSSRVELLRAVGANVKILVQFFYFAHPSVWTAIGYDGPFGRMPEQTSEQRAWYAQHTSGGRA